MRAGGQRVLVSTVVFYLSLTSDTYGRDCDCQSHRNPQYLLKDLCVCELKYVAITRDKIEVTREEFLIPKCGTLFSFLRDGHKPEQAKTVLEGTSYRT